MNDLLAESARYIIDKLIANMPQDTAEFIERLQSRPLEELHLITPEYLMPYLNIIKENHRIFRTVVAHSSVLGMDDAYLALNRYVFTPILDRFHVPPSEQKYMMPFYIHGLMGIINEWLKEDCKDSVEHIISVIQICIPYHQPREAQ
ncbi:MAG: TetR family transcriptional regulator C-terminal domain-containing protein [Galactobacillus timonensis]|nr:TetR family transcriptional regulator C-terminal domain-containing protein [Galactobacillus timonensis]